MGMGIKHGPPPRFVRDGKPLGSVASPPGEVCGSSKRKGAFPPLWQPPSCLCVREQRPGVPRVPQTGTWFALSVLLFFNLQVICLYLPLAFFFFKSPATTVDLFLSPFCSVCFCFILFEAVLLDVDAFRVLRLDLFSIMKCPSFSLVISSCLEVCLVCY